MQLSHMRFIKTSLPFTFSTMAASLMGAVDTAVVGHLGNYTYINAVSLGAVIFSTVYWLFGFLKISTSGFAAQAMGHHDPKLLAGAFLRGVLAAFAIGLVLVVLQEPIWRTALVLFNPDAATEPMLERYYRLLIWIMPLTLVFQTAQGWFAGTLHVRIAVLTALASNLINLVLDVLFVVVLNLEVTGVAAATCIANITGFLAILYFYWQHKPLPLTAVPLKEIFSGPTCRQMVQCGSHLTVRMFCMIIMVNSFMHQSSAFGGELLAANSILFQIQFIMGDILTGLSQAGAIYSGIAFGEHNKPMLNDTLRRLWPGAVRWLLCLPSCNIELLYRFAVGNSYRAGIRPLYRLLPAHQRVRHCLLRRFQRRIIYQAYLHFHAANCKLLSYSLLHANSALWQHRSVAGFLLLFVPKLQQRFT